MEGAFFALPWIGLSLSLPLLYAGWVEWRASNPRDARLLAGCGVGGVLLSAVGMAV